MKSFGHFIALQGVDLSIKEGEIVVIIGPSGSGKSTLIRCINQLEEHNGGDIVVDGIEIGAGSQARRSRPRSAWYSRASTSFRT